MRSAGWFVAAGPHLFGAGDLHDLAVVDCDHDFAEAKPNEGFADQLEGLGGTHETRIRDNGLIVKYNGTRATAAVFWCYPAMRRVLVAVFLVLACSTAHAEKDPKTATILAASSAGVSGAVVVTGFMTAPAGKRINPPITYTGVGLLFVTPSLGHFYAGQYLTWGMGIRLAAAAVAVYALETQTSLAVCDDATSSMDPPCEIFSEGAYPLLGIAAIGFIGGVWYDVLDADDAVHRYNKKHGMSIVPGVPTANGPAPGLTLTGFF